MVCSSWVVPRSTSGGSDWSVGRLLNLQVKILSALAFLVVTCALVGGAGWFALRQVNLAVDKADCANRAIKHAMAGDILLKQYALNHYSECMNGDCLSKAAELKAEFDCNIAVMLRLINAESGTEAVRHLQHRFESWYEGMLQFAGAVNTMHHAEARMVASARYAVEQVDVMQADQNAKLLGEIRDRENIDRIKDRQAKATDSARLKELMLHARRLEKNFSLDRDRQYYDSHTECLNNINDLAADLMRRFADPANIDQMVQMLGAVRQYSEAFGVYCQQIDETDLLLDKMAKATSELISEAELLRMVQKQRTADTTRAVTRLMLFMAVVCIVVGIVLAVILVRIMEAGRQARQKQDILEQELRHSQKMEAVGTLASGIAHDFNNLTAAINGFTGLIRKQLNNQQAVNYCLDQIDVATRQAKGITRSLLTFTRRTSAVKTTVDLHHVAKTAMRLLRRLIPATIELVDLTAGDVDAWVNGDELLLQQVIMNLAINSRDAMPCGGTISFELQGPRHANGNNDNTYSDEGSYIRLIVTDTGCGMSSQEQARAFEPFFTTKVRGEGTGLGLSIVHGIISEHGGSVQLQSRKGKGTTIVIALPCSRSFHENVSDSSGKPMFELDAAVEQRRIVLVDGNSYARKLIASRLRQVGHDVIEAENGRQMVQSIETDRDRIELAIIDLDMVQSGDVTYINSMMVNRPDLPVIALTGCDDFIRIAGRICRRGKLIRKPYAMEQMEQVVDQLMKVA